MQIKIVLTGGGSAGHVTPNLALIEALESRGWRIDYIGSLAGIERDMVEREGIPYHAISTGKFRRHVVWKNLLEPFKVLRGIYQAFCHLRRIRPQIVFSKGGFVAFPVVFSAWLLRIPVVAHESDLTPGLANRLSFPFVSKLCVSFEGAKAQFRHQGKVIVTGSPVRSSLFEGDPKRALKRCGFNGKKPVLLVVGGSLGAQKLNEVVRATLPTLCEHYSVLHLCGRGKIDASLKESADYFQCEYAHDEMADFMAASTLIVSRSGANALYEMLVLKKPHVLIPLSAKASRGDQIQNARYFEQQGVSVVLQDQDLTSETLLHAVDSVSQRLPDICAKIEALEIHSATERLVALIEVQAKHK
ncbi:MAG: undecaprenyldiphospho-muramoylpentapeptide beta-N-acetylglucosaminyltransferase [Gammaproteobacteria bacterium]|nr:undecaprenyldiphospho-muramoylpentapeptide beta-N-acetylglucosaminyltransferase [Gammaproteobacteria bacterium]